MGTPTRFIQTVHAQFCDSDRMEYRSYFKRAYKINEVHSIIKSKIFFSIANG